MLRKPLIATAAICALLTSAAYAEQNQGGGPTSTPTWTVPGKAIEEVTIKQKSNTVKEPPLTNAKAGAPQQPGKPLAKPEQPGHQPCGPTMPGKPNTSTC